MNERNGFYLIHLDDYIRHIDDKLALYAMLRQMEGLISKLPECASTTQVRKRMAEFSPRLKELWEGWNIPTRYLISGEPDDLSDVMDDELMEPEDAGYFNDGGYENGDGDVLADLAEYYLLELAKKAVSFAGELLEDGKELDFILNGDPGNDQ